MTEPTRSTASTSSSRLRVLSAYVSSPFLVAIVTFLLYRLQHSIGRYPDGDISRPYGIGYVLVVAALTVWGGFGPGIVGLFFSSAALLIFLIPPTFTFGIAHPADLAELFLLMGVGGLVLTTLEVARRARLRANLLLAASETARIRQQAVMEASPIGVLTCDAHGVLEYANSETERIWGRTLERVGREGWGQYGVRTPDGERVPSEQTGLGRVLGGEPGVIFNEVVVAREDGTQRRIQSQSTAIRDEQNHLLGAVTALIDVTERRQAEEAVRLSEERYRSLVEATAQIIWGTDATGEFAPPQPQWSAYTGQTPDEFSGQGWLEAVHPEDRVQAARFWQEAVASQRSYEGEHRLCRFDGEYRYFAIRAVPVMTRSGAIREWVGVHTDITARKNAEAERGRLLREAEQRADHAALLNQIGQAQRGGADPETVQAIAVEALGTALGASRCCFAWVEAGQSTVEILHDWHDSRLTGLRGSYRTEAFLSPLTAFFTQRQPLRVEDVRTHPTTQSNAAAFEAVGIRSLLAAPLHNGTQWTAALMVSANEPRLWADAEAELVDAVAVQTRTAMELAHLRLREHNIAERLQDALRPSLPDGIPSLDLSYYYRAALAEASVGGDFFDVFTVEKGCLALVIGDLSGKGLAAASQVATVRNMLRFALYRGRSLAEALTELNTIVAEHGLLQGFATLFVGLYDSGAGSLTYVSCGHEPALIRRAAGGTVIELETTGPVLGAFPDGDFEQQVVPLSEGDTLLLYTDGLSEAGRLRHDYLGSEGMARLLAAGPQGETASLLTRRLIDGVDRHTGGLPHDDQCLLAAIVSRRD